MECFLGTCLASTNAGWSSGSLAQAASASAASSWELGELGFSAAAGWKRHSSPSSVPNLQKENRLTSSAPQEKLAAATPATAARRGTSPAASAARAPFRPPSVGLFQPRLFQPVLQNQKLLQPLAILERRRQQALQGQKREQEEEHDRELLQLRLGRALPLP